MDFFKTPELKAEHSIEELKTYLYQCVRMNLELDKMKDLNMSENAHLREIVGRVVETYETE